MWLQVWLQTCGDKEEPEEQPAERSDVSLNLVAVLGLGEQDASEERACHIRKVVTDVVSASRTPARNAPSVSERPSAAVKPLRPRTVSRVIARNEVWSFALATRRYT
jgi:hypothetical protein